MSTASTAIAAALKDRQSVAEGTVAFRIEKPAGFAYKPGQAIEVGLADRPAAGCHAFSIVSAPSEDELVFATRIRASAFKEALMAAPIGAPLSLEGPFGSLTLHHNRSRRAVFIAGGIGITPFISMLRHASAERLPGEFLLLYSNRAPEQAAFLDELQELTGRMANFRLVATMTQARSNRWHGETVRIDAAFVRRTAGELAGSVGYVAGPPGLVAGVRQALNEAGMDDDDIRGEEFFGY